MSNPKGTWIDRVVSEVPQLERGRVWCTTCGRSESVNAAESLRHGWPKCCGYTMTVDSPEERKVSR
jgi:Zn finger protein HypA/HybF involved in hydrogenase expression